MKKFISLCLILITLCVMMTGCSKVTVLKEEQLNAESKLSMFVIVEEHSLWKVVYDIDTLCMYAVSYGGRSYGNFTLLVNADGTPRLWDK